MPRADAEALAAGAHAIVLLDQAGWHTTANLRTPQNITLLSLPPRSSELNPAENFWPFQRQAFLSNRDFETYEDLLAAACTALLDTGSLDVLGCR